MKLNSSRPFYAAMWRHRLPLAFSFLLALHGNRYEPRVRVYSLCMRVANDYARLALTLLPGVAKTEGGCSHGAAKSRARKNERMRMRTQRNFARALRLPPIFKFLPTPLIKCRFTQLDAPSALRAAHMLLILVRWVWYTKAICIVIAA